MSHCSLDAIRKECSLLDKGGRWAGTAEGGEPGVGLKQFCERLGVSEGDPASQALFNVFVEVSQKLMNYYYNMKGSSLSANSKLHMCTVLVQESLNPYASDQIFADCS